MDLNSQWGEGPSRRPPSQVHKTLKWGAMERSKKLDFPMWDTPPKPMQFMPLVVCVCERERARGIFNPSPP